MASADTDDDSAASACARAAEDTAVAEPPEPDEPDKALDQSEHPDPVPTTSDDAGATTVVDAPSQPDAARTTRLLPPGQSRTTRLPTGADMARWTGRTGGMPTVGAPLRTSTPSTQPSPDPMAPPPPPSDGEETGHVADQPWVMPTTAGVAALVLFAVLGVGIWLILHALGSGSAPAVPLSPTAAVSSVEAVADETPTMKASQPGVSVTQTADQVVIPDVEGKTQTAATQILDAAGLRVFVSYRDGEAAAGTVLGTEPAAGLPVAPGSTVTLLVARGPSPSPSRSPSPSASPLPSGSPDATS
ncbi:MAG: PASTA domain-containing protein [Dactylosporangium sp.]|nr:PASTA domain-containing protein [Dactylosporangium sp.]